jgi:hypothetical protein
VAPKSVTPPRSANMKNMEVRYRTYFAVLNVPRPLRPKVGSSKLLRSLKTDDYHVARARLNGALAELQKRLDPARDARASDNMVAAGLAWRDTFARIEAGDRSAFSASGPDGEVADPARLRWEAGIVAADQAEQIEGERGEAAADLFRGIAYGTATPLLLHVDAWLKEGGAKGPLNDRTADQYRADLGRFANWCASIGIASVEAVTPAVAGRYVTQELVGRQIHPNTGNRRISACSAYWRWMRKRAGIQADPSRCPMRRCAIRHTRLECKSGTR